MWEQGSEQRGVKQIEFLLQELTGPADRLCQHQTPCKREAWIVSTGWKGMSFFILLYPPSVECWNPLRQNVTQQHHCSGNEKMTKTERFETFTWLPWNVTWGPYGFVIPDQLFGMIAVLYFVRMIMQCEAQVAKHRKTWVKLRFIAHSWNSARTSLHARLSSARVAAFNKWLLHAHVNVVIKWIWTALVGPSESLPVI